MTVLSTEQKGKIAWLWLMDQMRGQKVRDVTLEQATDQIGGRLDTANNFFETTTPDTQVWDHLNDFIELLVDGCLGNLEDETGLTLSESELDTFGDTDQCWQLAYFVCVVQMYYHSERVGKNTKREVYKKASELGICKKDAEFFCKVAVIDMLDIAFFGNDEE